MRENGDFSYHIDQNTYFLMYKNNDAIEKNSAYDVSEMWEVPFDYFIFDIDS